MNDRERISQWLEKQRWSGLVDVSMTMDPTRSPDQAVSDLRVLIDAIEDGDYTSMTGEEL